MIIAVWDPFESIVLTH